MEALMGTFVSIDLVRDDPAADQAVERAFEWFREVERRCTRFDPSSELMQIGTIPCGTAVAVSPMVFQAIQFALTVAEESEGAFDPTIGRTMEARGFDREHRTGQPIRSTIEPDPNVSYQDVQIDAERQTVTLRRPLVLDLGAVAKGLAIDMAARELAEVGDFAIDAGGDLFLGGRNAAGQAWTVGIRHPRAEGVIESVQVSNQAVCTSGDYERLSGDGAGHHILDPRRRTTAWEAASVTVIASSAMLADALATAAFVLGPTIGIPWLERQQVEGVMFTSDLRRYATEGLAA
jgi:thiamine biosynthesis lipoprotein